MLLNGARHFSFIGRSATDKTAAAELVQDLRHNGAEVDVIRGDVQDSTSVDEALNRMRMPLGGVVQAAMGLGVNLVLTSFFASLNTNDSTGGPFRKHDPFKMAYEPWSKDTRNMEYP